MNTTDILTAYDTRPVEWHIVFRAMADLRKGRAVLKDERTTLERAYEAMTRPDFQRQMGRVPETLIAEGQRVAAVVADRLRPNQAAYEQGAPCRRCANTIYVRHGRHVECRVCRATQRQGVSQ